MQRINWTRLRDILIVIICIGIVLWATFSLLGLVVHAVVLLLLAMAVAFLVTPVVNLLNRYLPRALSAIIVYLMILAGLGILCYALVFSLIQQIVYFSNNLPGYVLNLPTTYSTVLNWLIKQGVPPTAIDKALATISDQSNAFVVSVATNLVSIVLIVTNAIINILLVAVISFYLTVDGKRVRDALVGLSPKAAMEHVLRFEDALNRVVGNYIRGQLTLAAIIGIMAGLGCFFLGLSNFALIVGVLALLVNGGVALLLYRYRAGDSNMRSVWICSRNDALANFAVVCGFWHRHWPAGCDGRHDYGDLGLWGGWQIIG